MQLPPYAAGTGMGQQGVNKFSIWEAKTGSSRREGTKCCAFGLLNIFIDRRKIFALLILSFGEKGSMLVYTVHFCSLYNYLN